MGLWIRSQDKKKLIKVNEIKIESVIDGNSFIYSDITDLGTYKTKERALEILDEIQNHLMELGKTYANADNRGIINGITYYGHVFEMPKE